MAYPKACVVIAHDVGRQLLAAAAVKRAAYNSAAAFQTIGMTGRGNQLRQMADSEFDRKKAALMEHMHVNGCL